MNTNMKANSTQKQSFAKTCAASCRKLLAQIKQTRENILSEFREKVANQEHLLGLALNEAETAAWQSGVPALVFADLATEKAQAVAAWHQHQQAVLRATSVGRLAA